MKQFFKLGVTVAVVASVVAACTAKKRDVSFAQGQGQNLLAVGDYDGKTFDLTTSTTVGDKNSKALNVSTAKSTKDKDGKDTSVQIAAKGMQSFSVVNYKTDATLIKDAAVVGAENHKYKVIYKLTENYLKIYKIGTADDIPYQEQSYAVKTGGAGSEVPELTEGQMAVPLMGYPIKGYFKVEKAVNDNGEDTSKLIEIPANGRADATHFKIDQNSPEIFKAIEKANTVKASLFDGEWYYAETLIYNSGISGRHNDDDMVVVGQTTQGNSHNFIKFQRNNDKIEALSLNRDQKVKDDPLTDKDSNLYTVMSIPVTNHAYRATKMGNGTALNEEENNEINWSEKDYITLDLEHTSGLTFGHENNELKSLVITDDYISYVLENSRSKMRTRISFARAKKSDYQSRIAFRDDLKKFGFFNSKQEKDSTITYDIYTQKDAEKLVKMNRFDLNKANTVAGLKQAHQPVIYRFSKNSPEYLRAAAAQVVENWNQAFRAAAGITDPNDKTVFVMLDKEDADLGDVRYNIINLVESNVENPLFGFGPSLSDVRTGEIVSVTANVYVTEIREALGQELRFYLRAKRNKQSNTFMSSIATLLEWKPNVEANNSGTKSDTIEVQGFKNTSALTKSITTDSQGQQTNSAGLKLVLPNDQGGTVKKNVEFANLVKKMGYEDGFGISTKGLAKDIEAQCPEIVRIADRPAADDDDLKAVDSCSLKLTPMKMQGTLVHEMGHTFGLMHNFMGSVDKANFWDAKTTGTDSQVPSSSVMEYSAFEDLRLAQPGPYDIAAIQFGYFGKVLTMNKDASGRLSNGSVIELDTTKTLAENLNGKIARPYMFCSDYEFMYDTTPLCHQHDSGTTPTEIVKNIISNYNESIVYGNQRDGRAVSNGFNQYTKAFARLDMYFMPLMKFYEEWRVQLAKYVQSKNQYLEKFTITDYNNTIDAMFADPAFKGSKEYHDAAILVYNFFKQVALESNHYCVVKKDNQLSFLEYEDTRKNAYASTKIAATSCSDLGSVWDAQGYTYLTEIGSNLNDVTFDQDIMAYRDSTDVVGRYVERLMASSLLGARNPQEYMSYVNHFYPSFMDEPILRDDWLKATTDRLLNGISQAQLVEEMKIHLGRETVGKLSEADLALVPKYLPKFRSEKNIVVTMISELADGALIPGSFTSSLDRLKAIGGSLVLTSSGLQSSGLAYYNVTDTYAYVAMSKDNVVSLNLIRRANQLSAAKASPNYDEAKSASLLDALIKATKGKLLKKADADKFLVSDFMSAMAPIMEFYKNASKEDQAMLMALLGSHIDFATQIDSINTQVKGDADKYAKFKSQILDQTMASFAQKAGASIDVVIYEETFEKSLKTKISNVVTYHKDPYEYDAQLEAIVNVMLSVGSILR